MALVAYALGRGLLLAWLIPPWQGPDEPGHAEHAMLVAGRYPAGVDAPRLQAAILQSMAANDFWRLVEAPAPDPPPEAFDDVPWFAGEEAQHADETPIGYLPMAAALRLGPAAELQDLLARMRLTSVVLTALLAMGALALARRALPAPSAPAAALAAVALPMVGFAGSITNNDLAAAALATAWFAALAAALARPGLGRGRERIAVLVGLALLAAASKRTGLYVVGVLPLALWEVWRARAAWRERRPPGSGSMAPARPPGASAWTVMALAVFGALALLPLPDRAPGWTVTGEPRGPARARAAARTGVWGIQVVDRRSDGWQYIERSWPVAGGELVEARAWLRASGGGRASLALSDDAGTWQATLVDLVPGAWTEVVVVAALPVPARVVRLAIVPGDGSLAGTGAIDIDDASMVIGGRAVLANGGAERPVRVGSTLVRWAAEYANLPRMAAAAGPALSNPAGSLARLWRGLAFAEQSFWGGFGWLKVWPPASYSALAMGVTAWAIAAMAVAITAPGWLAGEPRGGDARRRRGEPEATETLPVLLRLCGIAALAAIAVAVLGSLAGTGDQKLPQGRYLIAAVAPLAMPAAALAERVASRLGGRPGLGAWLLAAAVVALDAWAVFGVMWAAFR